MPSPLIGVTAARTTSKSGHPLASLAQAYIKALTQAAACPVIVPSGLPEDNLEELLSRLDAVLFTGGGDIHPSAYGEVSRPEIKEIDPDRDRTEFKLLDRALNKGVPFFGICRGLQVVNVGLGGTLYADVASQHPRALKHDFYPDWPRDHLAHQVRVEGKSRLAEVLGDTEFKVNSLHHQAVQRLAPGILVTARSPDGLIEAIEVSDHPFGLAVQWHPEWLTPHAPMRALFQAFVEAARARIEA